MVTNDARKLIYDAAISTGLNVYDYWQKDNTAYPYIIIMDVKAGSQALKLNVYNDYYCDVHVYYKQLGKQSALQTLEQIETQLMSATGIHDLRLVKRVTNEAETGLSHGSLNIQFKYYN